VTTACPEFHQARRREAQRREALQIVGIPLADMAGAQDRLAALHQPRIFGRVHDPDVEAVRRGSTRL
jgi:hypothetical protein